MKIFYSWFVAKKNKNNNKASFRTFDHSSWSKKVSSILAVRKWLKFSLLCESKASLNWSWKADGASICLHSNQTFKCHTIVIFFGIICLKNCRMRTSWIQLDLDFRPPNPSRPMEMFISGASATILSIFLCTKQKKQVKLCGDVIYILMNVQIESIDNNHNGNCYRAVNPFRGSIA